MKRTLIFAKRNLKEILRDKLSLIFCIAFPTVMLVFMELIFSGKGDVQMFDIENFAPGIVTFGFTFTALITAIYIAGDKSSCFFSRILCSPVKPFEYFLSYMLSALPICFCQILLFYVISFAFGLTPSLSLLVSVVYLIPAMFFYISCGLLIGAIVSNDKQAGPLASVFISASGILGGVWFPLESIGGGFLTVSKALPFYNGVKVAIGAVNGDYSMMFPCGIITLAYAFAVFILSVFFFKKSIKE